MKTTVLLVMTSLVLTALPLRADPGGQPNPNSRKKRDRAEAVQHADNVKIIAIGGYRNENLYESGERWRADKAQAHRDDKARRDRDAQERLAREQTRRAGDRARNDREKLAKQQDRGTEKRAKAEREAAKRDQVAKREGRDR